MIKIIKAVIYCAKRKNKKLDLIAKLYFQIRLNAIYQIKWLYRLLSKVGII